MSKTKAELVAAIDSLLPQTQCTRCGFPSCRDYAVAISEDKAEINQCPPGGPDGIAKLAALLQRPVLELNPQHGTFKAREIAIIDEDACIGCTLCIKACPVDAIIGGNKMMHTVIASECSGCDLCLPVCPVDCITLIVDPEQTWEGPRRDLALQRFNTHNQRRELESREREQRFAGRAELLKKMTTTTSSSEDTAEPAAEANTAKSDFIRQIMTKAQQSSK